MISRQHLLLIGLAFAGFVNAGCSSSTAASYQNAGDPPRALDPAPNSGQSGSTAAPPPPVAPVTTKGGVVSAGILTAGVWDDNLNYIWYVTHGTLMLSQEEHYKAYELSKLPKTPKEKLDIMLVLDTTGSMGDELSYLQAELSNIRTGIETAYPNADTRWSLVLYRDQGDEYVTKTLDFVSDAATFDTALKKAYAYGGGDFPEAAFEALDEAITLGWRSEPNVSKLLFWVADAPGRGVPAMAAKAAQAKDIHVYPVASSGIDKPTETFMRGIAQLTLGRYIFLTDDSGIGNPHTEPSIPCYYVTRLDSAMLRMVDIEMSGAYREPDPSEVIRVGGSPTGNVCKIDDVDLTAY